MAAKKIYGMQAFERNLKTLYCVSNSGVCGYLCDSVYYTRKKDAFKKVDYWLNIGDMPRVSTVSVFPDGYKIIQEEYGGRISSADYYDIVSKHSVMI